MVDMSEFGEESNDRSSATCSFVQVVNADERGGRVEAHRAEIA